jgi:hypothetical protein
MPYGLPGAVKLSLPVLAHDWQTLAPVRLREGALVQPIHPGADQDGWDGEWRCRTADGKELAISGDALRLSAGS